MIVLKLGGSVITRKDEPETVDEAALEAAAAAVATAPEPVVTVHGGGSFGHHHAAAHGVSRTEGTHDAAAARAVHGAMRRLNDAVVEALAAHDVPAVPVAPLSTGHRAAGGELTLPMGAVRTLLAEGFWPVLHGDLVAHAGHGVTVLSGDEVVTTLAEALAPSRVGLCSTVPGILDAAGEVVPTVSEYAAVADVLEGSAATDVTGGMAGKVRALLELDAPASVFGPDAIEGFLAGGEPGTTVR